jgi:hypothetical protein
MLKMEMFEVYCDRLMLHEIFAIYCDRLMLHWEIVAI